MNYRLFELFAEMIDGIPVEGILRAMELEHGMLEDDLLHKRIGETPDVDSILTFCQFINAVIDKESFSPIALPISHVAFYRKVVIRLMAAGKIPLSAKRDFDFTFSFSSFSAVVNN